MYKLVFTKTNGETVEAIYDELIRKSPLDLPTQYISRDGFMRIIYLEDLIENTDVVLSEVFVQTMTYPYTTDGKIQYTEKNWTPCMHMIKEFIVTPFYNAPTTTLHVVLIPEEHSGTCQFVRAFCHHLPDNTAIIETIDNKLHYLTGRTVDGFDCSDKLIRTIEITLQEREIFIDKMKLVAVGAINSLGYSLNVTKVQKYVGAFDGYQTLGHTITMIYRKELADRPKKENFFKRAIRVLKGDI